ncbi:SCO0930 family lipoprotein [Streptomyces uncialis]|uniref:SCO0930 family lipoprotein n=1 Tax=Streptomyces uncialis TaxID=1048205 RepID=UPI0036631F1C
MRNPRKTRSATVTAAGTATALALLSACGSGQGEPGSVRSTVASSPGTAETDTAPPDAGSGPSAAGKLGVRTGGALGKVVTDSEGRTLYRFDNDAARPSNSTCDGGCAQMWPPVLAMGTRAARGMDPSLLGEVTRTDGSQQLTLDGWPLYRFAEDTAPGRAKGQGVGGTWFAAAPDGTKAGAPAPAPVEPLPALSTRDDAKLGEIVRDAEGRTLYRFTKDRASPKKPACADSCLKKWKPAKMLERAALKNAKDIDPKLIIPYRRPDDGGVQLTIDGWPLYWFTGDLKPGDTNGQGVGGTWFAIRKTGNLAK